MPLPEPTTSSGRAALRLLVAEPARALIGLDFDGTLSPIVENPDEARPAPGAVAAVRRLAATVGAVAIVTGRPAPVAVGLLGLGADDPDNLLVLGHYGLQRWTSRGGVRVSATFDAAAVAAVRDRLPSLLRDVGAPAGVAIEDKGESVAVHVRRTASPDDAFTLLRGPLASLASSHGLRLEPGRMVLELRPAGVDKGIAVEALVGEVGATVACYAGDDLGDLAAYDALDRLGERGVSTLKICSGFDEVPQLQERADLVLDGPAELVGFLDGLADVIDRTGPS
jgi:trehalose 6-phosphate phosphatase